jgi:hypothetical protein
MHFPIKSSSLQVHPLHGFTLRVVTPGAADSDFIRCTIMCIFGFTRTSPLAEAIARHLSKTCPAFSAAARSHSSSQMPAETKMPCNQKLETAEMSMPYPNVKMSMISMLKTSQKLIC